MPYTLAYQAKYRALVVEASTGKIYRKMVVGPVYPLFLQTNLSNHEGFMRCVEQIGIDGFCYLDEDTGFKFPLSKEIDRVLQIGDVIKEEELGKEKKLAKSYLENFYKRNRDRLLGEQNVMKLFHQWVVKGKYRPSLQNIQGPVDQSHLKAYPGFLPLDRGDSVSQIIGTIRYHFSKVCLELVVEPNPQENKRFRGTDYRRFFQLDFSYSTLPALCYMEMFDLAEDEKELRECALCGKEFVATHDREKYCLNPAPGYNAPKKSCRKIGPQTMYWKNKPEKELDRMRQKKRFQSSLSYLKRRGRDKEYREVETEFKRWQKMTQQKKGVSHGKKAR